MGASSPHPLMSPDIDRVVFPDVELVEEAPAGLRCRVNGTLVWIPRAGIHAAWGSVRPGDRAPLVVMRWVAEGLGLPIPGKTE